METMQKIDVTYVKKYVKLIINEFKSDINKHYNGNNKPEVVIITGKPIDERDEYLYDIYVDEKSRNASSYKQDEFNVDIIKKTISIIKKQGFNVKSSSKNSDTYKRYTISLNMKVKFTSFLVVIFVGSIFVLTQILYFGIFYF